MAMSRCEYIALNLKFFYKLEMFWLKNSSINIYDTSNNEMQKVIF